MKNLVTLVCASLVFATSSIGCSSTPKEERDLGDVTVGTNTLHIALEGSGVAAGAGSRFVIKATAGTKPTSITGWIGTMEGEGSVKKLSTYDANDGDFDDDVVAPSPIPPGSKYWFQVETDGKTTLGSIAY